VYFCIMCNECHEESNDSQVFRTGYMVLEEKIIYLGICQMEDDGQSETDVSIT
jgi:hypothetical protein